MVEFADLGLEVVEFLAHVFLVLMGEAVHIDSVDDAEADHATGEDNGRKEEPDPSCPGGVVSSNGIWNHIPSLDGENLEKGVKAVRGGREKLGCGIAEKLCAEDGKNEGIDGQPCNDKEGGLECTHGSPDDGLHVRDELEKEEELEGPDEAEDEQELGIVNGHEQLYDGGEAEDHYYKIEHVPFVPEELPGTLLLHLERHLHSEENGEEIVGPLQPGVVA